jgi:hypothetical protein
MSGEQFKPVFGPNGAVMNSPSMTAEGGEPSRGSSGLATRGEIYWKYYPYLIGLGVVALVLLDLRRASDWWAGVFLGACVVVAARCVQRLAQHSLQRWELLRTDQGKLTAPKWLRVLVATTEILGSAAFCTWFVASSCAVDRELDFVRGIAALLAFSMATLRVVIEQLNAWELEQGIFP